MTKENKNYPKNADLFLGEIAGYINEPSQVNGVLLVPLKRSVLSRCETLSDCRSHVSEVARVLGLSDILSFSLFNENNQVEPVYKIDLSRSNGNYFKLDYPLTQVTPATPIFDMEKLHIEKLKTAFHEVSPNEIKESIQFLCEKGWTDNDFTREFNISKTTIWRYKNKVINKKPLSQ